MSDDTGYQGLPGDTVSAISPSLRTENTTPKKRGGNRPVKYPIQLRVNLNTEMGAALRRVSQRFGIPESIAGRIALGMYLAAHDAQYQHEVEQEAMRGNGYA
jgi:hypothetical protein